MLQTRSFTSAAGLASSSSSAAGLASSSLPGKHKSTKSLYLYIRFFAFVSFASNFPPKFASHTLRLSPIIIPSAPNDEALTLSTTSKLKRLKPFNFNLLYHNRLKIDPELEKEICAKFKKDLDVMLPSVTLSGLFDKERISKLKKGVFIVNNARRAIMDTQAVVDACLSGHSAGSKCIRRFAVSLPPLRLFVIY